MDRAARVCERLYCAHRRRSRGQRGADLRPPRVVFARRTLGLIVAILAMFLAGIALLSRSYGIAATPPGEHGFESILSQIVGAVVGHGAFFTSR